MGNTAMALMRLDPESAASGHLLDIEQASIHHVLSDNLPTVRADVSQVRQIIMNLIINAAEAIGEEQGTILVTIRRVDVASAGAENDHLGR